MQGFTPLAVCSAIVQKAVAAISQALLAATVAFLVLVTPTIADEGMWRPQQLLKLRHIKGRGLKAARRGNFRAHRFSDERGDQSRWLHGIVCLTKRPDCHQSSLRLQQYSTQQYGR